MIPFETDGTFYAGGSVDKIIIAGLRVTKSQGGDGTGTTCSKYTIRIANKDRKLNSFKNAINLFIQYTSCFFCIGRELGFRKPSAQSSTLQSHITEAFNALDGRAVDSDMLQCSVTKKTANPKWSVDLGMLYKIHRIVIHNLETDDTRCTYI